MAEPRLPPAQLTPESGGQVTPETGGQVTPDTGGQLTPDTGGQLTPGPVDPRLLEEALRTEAARPFPWRALALFFVPAAGLAGGAALQFVVEGPQPAGDALLRWLFFSAGAGLVAGALVGLLLSRGRLARIGWAALGAGAPFLLSALTVAAVQLARPLRVELSKIGEAKCRKTRTLCSAREFSAACAEAGRGATAAAARARLGPPAQSLCSGAGCTERWTYAGPWTPDNYVQPGSLLCSVVTDANGAPSRFALGPGQDTRE